MSTTDQPKQHADVERKRKEMSTDETINTLPPVSENRLHKRRQRKRNQDRKQNALTELMDRIESLEDKNLSASNVKNMYSSIPVLDPNHQKFFWNKVPCMCDPCKAIMDQSIADDSKLDRDKKYQKKYQKKLAAKQRRGKITEAEKQEMLSKHGRSADDTKVMTLLSAQRGQRKAWQIENFAFLLTRLFNKRPEKKNNPFTVVDFGCGSGNLCLALAAYFEHVRFVLVDKKPYPLKLAQGRAKEAGLKNVEILQYTFSPQNLSDFLPTSNKTDTANNREELMKFDVGIGLHCCGSFTDMVMELCLARGATCIVCPCCNGAMTSKTTSGYQYPRSSSFRGIMTQDEYLGQLSKSADDLGNYDAKCLIEYDRALWAKESGFQEVSMWKLNPTESTPKHHVLCLEC